MYDKGRKGNNITGNFFLDKSCFQYYIWCTIVLLRGFYGFVCTTKRLSHH